MSLTTLRSYRFVGTALFDFVLTILCAAYVTHKTQIPLVITTVCGFILGEFVHKMIGIETNTLKYLFGN